MNSAEQINLSLLKLGNGKSLGHSKEVEKIVIERDKKCVYCGVDFTTLGKSRKTRQTWEHIINDIRINCLENIVLCCGSCNASKGTKILEDWIKSKYCL